MMFHRRILSAAVVTIALLATGSAWAAGLPAAQHAAQNTALADPPAAMSAQRPAILTGAVRPAADSPEALRVQTPPCFPHADVVDALGKKFGERITGLGLSKNQQSVLELYVSDGGSWTVLITNAQGVSCVRAMGESWTHVASEDAGL